MIFRDLPLFVLYLFISLLAVLETFFYLCRTILFTLYLFSLRIHALLKSLGEAQADSLPFYLFLLKLYVRMLLIAIVLSHEFFVLLESVDDISKRYLFESSGLGKEICFL